MENITTSLDNPKSLLMTHPEVMPHADSISDNGMVLKDEKQSTEPSQEQNFFNKLIHTAGHDLRSPLFVVRSYSQLLQRTQEKEKLERGFNLMSEATYKMENIINALVGLVDVYSTSKPSLEEISFEDILNKAKYTLCNELAEFDPLIKSDFGFYSNIQFTSNYLEEVFVALLDNSMRHNSTQKDLEINLTTYEQDEYIVLEISDNGNGAIEIKDLEVLKQPFYSFTEDPKCVGIGLSKVDAIMQTYDGKFEIKRDVDKGLICQMYFKK